LGDCCPGDSKFAWIVDGVDAMRRAVREELRLGARQIKIMASGGILSPADPVDNLQFSDEEIFAAVVEAAHHGSYVSAHCHPARAIRRCANLGVRVIEHATMMDQAAAEALVANKTYAVPTLAILEGLKQKGEALGFPAENMEKLHRVREHAAQSVKMLRRYGIPIGFGTDLFGKTHGLEHTEFRLRSGLEKPLDILRSATSVNAEILRSSGELGCIGKNALADLIVVRGDPLENVLLLEQPENLLLVMKDGVICRDRRPNGDYRRDR
jgi:imidazolonepropionase-like amidohydrolase